MIVPLLVANVFCKACARGKSLSVPWVPSCRRLSESPARQSELSLTTAGKVSALGALPGTSRNLAGAWISRRPPQIIGHRARQCKRREKSDKSLDQQKENVNER